QEPRNPGTRNPEPGTWKAPPMTDDRGKPSSPSIDDRAKRAEHGSQPPAPPAPSCVMVIFGASGDLTRRKLVPALFNLRVGGVQPRAESVQSARRGAAA